MQTLLILSLIIVFSQADYLNTRNNNHCITNLTPYQNRSGWCYHDQNTDDDLCDLRLTMDDLINGYEYRDGQCLLKNDLALTGLTQNQWDYLMAVLAHVLGFTFLFLINFLAILIVRK